jgi:hypothetical protein
MSPENNGGKTNYYDLPLPDKGILLSILIDVSEGNLNPIEATNKILDLCPQTLIDLIEYKNMQPYQHEIFKATYAMNERAKRGKFASIVREINKIIYYAQRGLKLAVKEQNK